MKRGFTLIELLVAIGVFSILVAIGIGGFARALHTQREVAALIASQSNVSLALEQVAREIRTGYLFCDSPGNSVTSPMGPNSVCQWNPSNGSGCIESGPVSAPTWTCNDILDFYNADGQEVDYALENGMLERSQGGPGAYSAITGGDVTVQYLKFTIWGNTEGDNWPPRITISLGVAPNSTDPAVASDTINLQTTVSAREIDCTTGPSVSC